MRGWILIFCTVSAIGLHTGCLQTDNSSALDEALYSPGSAEFQRAKSIMLSQCASCHDYHGRTEAELIASGLVVQGSPENSPIFYRLTGSSGVNGPKNMPPAAALTASQLADINAWILGL